MLIVILLYDQLLFRPLVAWVDRFRFEQEAGACRRDPGCSRCSADPVWSNAGRSRGVAALVLPARPPLASSTPAEVRDVRALGQRDVDRRRPDRWRAFALWRIGRFVLEGVGLRGRQRPLLGAVTLVRVLVLIAMASLIWVPIGVGVGIRPDLARIVQPVAQFLAAFPANLLFPMAVSAIVAFALNPDIWLSPLMILGTQWYILFNVIAGASALPSELRDVGTNLQRPWLAVVAKDRAPGCFPIT